MRPLPDLAQRVRDGADVTDDEFDQVFPERLRTMSRVHWTPVATARRVVELLAPLPGEVMLDVGSGVGKVCLVGALSSSAYWRGVELRRSLVTAANAAAKVLGVDERTRFVQTDVVSYDWRGVDGVYLYNPFGELRMSWDAESLREVGPLAGDRTRGARDARYRSLVAAAEEKAWGLRIGGRLATFHGFGGAWPRCLDLVHREPMGTDCLELWVRVGAVRPRSARESFEDLFER